MKKIIFIILFIICSCLAYMGFLVSSNRKSIAYSMANPSEYGLLNTIKINDEEVSYFDQLYLRGDNSFYLSINSYYLDRIMVGTYHINNNRITLNISVLYSNDGCFYKDSLETINGNIDNNKIVFEYNGVKKEFIKGVGVSETSTNRSYYVLNPTSDSSPEGIINGWKDCSKKLTKK